MESRGVPSQRRVDVKEEGALCFLSTHTEHSALYIFIDLLLLEASSFCMLNDLTDLKTVNQSFLCFSKRQLNNRRTLIYCAPQTHIKWRPLKSLRCRPR